MDYQLNKVTRDRVSAFITNSLVLRTIHSGLLPNLGASSLQFGVASSGDLTASASVDSPIVTTEQQQVPPAGDEVSVTNEGQSIDDIPPGSASK